MTDSKCRFMNKIYNEFEQNLLRVFGYSIENLKTVLDRPDTEEREGHNLDQELKAAFEEGGAIGLRREMNCIIARLEAVYMMDELGRKPTFEEWIHRVEELDFGMKRSDMTNFFNS